MKQFMFYHFKFYCQGQVSREIINKVIWEYYGASAWTDPEPYDTQLKIELSEHR